MHSMHGEGMIYIMEMAKVTSKGQITIPISIRRRLGISEGDKLLFIDRPEGVMMVNPDALPGGQPEEELEAAAPVAAAPKKTASSAPPAAAKTSDRNAAPVRTPLSALDATKPAAQVGGFDLNTLLDEIRSIGSNI